MPARASLPEVAAAFRALSDEESEGVVSQLRYAGYIDRQQREAARLADEEGMGSRPTCRTGCPGSPREMIEKLSSRPAGLARTGQPHPGVTPAAISIVRMHLRRGMRCDPDAVEDA